jgi:hypothetical protein
MIYTGTAGVLKHGEQIIGNITAFNITEGDEACGQIGFANPNGGEEIVKDVFTLVGTADIDVDRSDAVGVLVNIEFVVSENHTIHATGFITGVDQDTVTFEGTGY